MGTYIWKVIPYLSEDEPVDSDIYTSEYEAVRFAKKLIRFNSFTEIQFCIVEKWTEDQTKMIESQRISS